jgi:hypothetical protein
MKTIKCVGIGTNSDGQADCFPCFVECTDEQYNCGEHYDAVVDEMEEHGYSKSIVADENEPLFAYFLNAIDWHGDITSISL